MNSHTHLLGPKERKHWCLRNSPYFELVKYLAPVALTLIAIDVGEQVCRMTEVVHLALWVKVDCFSKG